MNTLNDFSAFAMHRLKLTKLTREVLVGLVFNLLKGTCKSCVELGYNMEECFRALTDQLDWTNPEGYDHPVDMSKPLPLQEKSDRLIIPIEVFYNNDLEYLKGDKSERTYSSSITKTPAASEVRSLPEALAKSEDSLSEFPLCLKLFTPGLDLCISRKYQTPQTRLFLSLKLVNIRFSGCACEKSAGRKFVPVMLVIFIKPYYRKVSYDNFRALEVELWLHQMSTLEENRRGDVKQECLRNLGIMQVLVYECSCENLEIFDFRDCEVTFVLKWEGQVRIADITDLNSP
ncbi:hypothetical protein Tco_0532635 [Tanacetum coccineum]